MNKFFGTGVALITPFTPDGAVDQTGLKNVIDHVIKGGVEYIVSLGTTGESATLSADEKKLIWSLTVEHVAGRVPIMAGVGGNNTAEVIADMKGIDTYGFDAILSVSPYYNKPSQEGIYQHYKAVASQCPLPLMLYNVPGRTGMNMTAETTLRLAHECSNVIGTKDACANFDQFSRIMRDAPEGFLFVSGDDGVTLPLIAMGSAGTISVIANAVPEIFSTMTRMCLDGKFAEAQPLHYSMVELTSLLFVEGNPPGVKSALADLGVCGSTVRLPLVNVSENTREAIRRELEKLSVL